MPAKELIKLEILPKLARWLGFLLLGLGCTQLLPFSTANSQPILTHNEILRQLQGIDIIYLGETHDSPQDHVAQLEIVRSLQQQQPSVAIAMEMFQRPFQEALNRYLQGKLEEKQLREQTEYDKRWGFDWEFYAPLLRFARAEQLPVLAINTPSEVTRQVARGGLERLTEAERRYIPPLSALNLGNTAYRERLRESYAAHGRSAEDEAGFERFFAAQVLWDETMAEAIAEFWQDNPDYQVVVIAGRGHVVYGYGIPDRVARRLPQSLQQRIVLMGTVTEEDWTSKPAPGDFFWQHEPEQTPQNFTLSGYHSGKQIMLAIDAQADCRCAPP